MKECTKCNELKELTEFHNNKGSKDGLSPKCKDCDKEYKQANKESIATYGVAYRELNRGTIATRMADYREANKEALAAREAAYRKTPKGKAVNKNARHKRRALIKEGLVTTQELQELLDNNPTCLYCECEVTDDTRHIDHYHPLSKGGLHDISNLAVTCAECNRRKSNKMPDIFIATLPEEDQERIKSLQHGGIDGKNNEQF